MAFRTGDSRFQNARTPRPRPATGAFRGLETTGDGGPDDACEQTASLGQRREE